jgi:hypothetical protein
VKKPSDKPDETVLLDQAVSEPTSGGEDGERDLEAEQEKSALRANELADSAAWLDYCTAHAKAVPFIEQHAARPRDASATSDQLAHLYATLFDSRHVDDGGASFHQTLKDLQTTLRGSFNPKNLSDRGAAVNAFLNRYYPMKLPPRDPKDPPREPPTPTITLSREQVIELWHIFVAQADIKILSPWSDTGDGNKPW